jgi:predicted RNase H-like HicB family nuclease
VATHVEILEAVRRITASRADWSFTPDEIVRALPHLNPGTVRTHITSRCCINAPKNHPHKWDYFERVSRGRYRLVPRYRPARGTTASRVREARSTYSSMATARKHAVHAVISRSGSWYAAECLELAVVTQGRTLDETVANLKDAINLHLEEEDVAAFGIALPVTLHVVYEDDVA